MVGSAAVQFRVVPSAAMVTPARPVSVLLVEDDQSVVDMLRRHLTRAGMTVHAVSNEHDAVRRTVAHVPDLVILDLWCSL